MLCGVGYGDVEEFLALQNFWMEGAILPRIFGGQQELEVGQVVLGGVRSVFGRLGIADMSASS